MDNGKKVVKKLGLSSGILDALCKAENRSIPILVIDPNAPYDIAKKYKMSHPHLLFADGVFREYRTQI